VVALGKIEDYKNSFVEVMWIAKNTLSTFWFWFPIAYMAYVIVQLWLMFYVHPLTLAILPVTLIIYGIRLEEKRVKLRYGLGAKRLKAVNAMGAPPEPVELKQWEVEQSVEQYKEMLKGHKKEKRE
jgi:hypothetical protein